MRRWLRTLLIVLASVAAGWWLFADTVRFYTVGADRLRVAIWGDYEEYEMWKAIVAGFRAKQPGVPVKIEYYTDNYPAKLQQQLVAGTAPDVFVWQDEPFPGLAREGKFVPLDGYLATAGHEVALRRDYWKTAVDSFVVDGVAYGIPIWGGANLVYYNKDAFDRAGVPYPDDDWTFDEFLETCRKLTRDFDGDGRIDQFGFVLPGWVYFLPWLWGNDAAILDESRTRWTFFGERVEQILQWYTDLVNAEHVSPRAVELGQGGQNVGFLTQRVAMFTSGPWNMPFNNTAGIRYDVAHIPSGPLGGGARVRATRVTWDALVIFTGSKRKGQAWRFIHHATGPAGAAVIARFQRSVPALRSAADAFVKANPRVSACKFVEAFDYARMQPISPHYVMMERYLNREFSRLSNGLQDVRTTIDAWLANRELMAALPPAHERTGRPDGGPD